MINNQLKMEDQDQEEHLARGADSSRAQVKHKPAVTNPRGYLA